MSPPPAPRPDARAVFTRGSILRHVLVMTATGSVGLMAIFVVDLFSLLYISWYRDPNLTAGIGFATQILFFTISLNIGLSIGVSALVSRALGSGDRAGARRLATSGLIHSLVVSGVFGIVLGFYGGPLLSALGARGGALEAGTTFLNWTLPTTGLMSMGMTLSSVLRAVGDARRAMLVTLIGAIVTAAIDPVLIFGLKLGVTGAALSANASRLTWIAIGLWGVGRVHGLLGRPTWADVLADLGSVMRIALPAVLTNFAAPVANVYMVHTLASFGEAAVAGGAIVDRVTPVAFGPLFAMSSVVGPIIGQNYGARLFGRVREVITACFALAAGYVGAMWLLLWLCAPGVVWLFSAHGETAEIILFFCAWGASAWAFLGCVFAANAAFNNLDYPLVSTVINWGRATLGVIPFVTIGARLYGAEGVYLGVVAGAALFGIASIGAAYAVVARLARRFGPVAASAPVLS